MTEEQTVEQTEATEGEAREETQYEKDLRELRENAEGNIEEYRLVESGEVVQVMKDGSLIFPGAPIYTEPGDLRAADFTTFEGQKLSYEQATSGELTHESVQQELKASEKTEEETEEEKRIALENARAEQAERDRLETQNADSAYDINLGTLAVSTSEEGDGNAPTQEEVDRAQAALKQEEAERTPATPPEAPVDRPSRFDKTVTKEPEDPEEDPADNN